MRYIPCVYSETGGSLPKADPRVQDDFVRQHVRNGWGREDAEIRYALWAAGRIETNPEMALTGTKRTSSSK